MPTVARKRHPKPAFFTLARSGRHRIAKATILPLGDYEYTLHTTKGWRRKRLFDEPDIADDGDIDDTE